MILRDEERDVTVLALEKIGRRIVLVLAASALHDPAFGRVVKGDVLVQRHARLNRRIDPRADAARFPLPERQHYPVSGEETGIIIRLRFRRIARRHLWIAADVEQPTHGRADDIRRLEVRVGSVLAETADGDQNQFLLPLYQRFMAEILRGEIAGFKTLDHDVGARHQIEQ